MSCFCKIGCVCVCVSLSLCVCVYVLACVPVRVPRHVRVLALGVRHQSFARDITDTLTSRDKRHHTHALFT